MFQELDVSAEMTGPAPNEGDNNVDAELEGLARYQLLNRIGEGMVRPSHVTDITPYGGDGTG